MKQELLPCPFCGRIPKIVTSGAITKSKRCLGGCCVSCDCGASLGFDGIDCVGEIIGAFNFKDEAISEWNKRFPLAISQELAKS